MSGKVWSFFITRGSSAHCTGEMSTVALVSCPPALVTLPFSLCPEFLDNYASPAEEDFFIAGKTSLRGSRSCRVFTNFENVLIHAERQMFSFHRYQEQLGTKIKVLFFSEAKPPKDFAMLSSNLKNPHSFQFSLMWLSQSLTGSVYNQSLPSAGLYHFLLLCFSFETPWRVNFVKKNSRGLHPPICNHGKRSSSSFRSHRIHIFKVNLRKAIVCTLKTVGKYFCSP